jgi:hypothetical protein
MRYETPMSYEHTPYDIGNGNGYGYGEQKDGAYKAPMALYILMEREEEVEGSN